MGVIMHIGLGNPINQELYSPVFNKGQKVKKQPQQSRVDKKIQRQAKQKGLDPLIETDLHNKEAEPLLQKKIVNLHTPLQQSSIDYQASLTADFAERDTLPQTNVKKDHWFDLCYGKWGPLSKTFPKPQVPKGFDPVQWKRDRILEAAKHFVGLPYERNDGMRGHFPARGCGLDCSTFAAWVYNYALGIRFSAVVDDLASKSYKAAGRFIGPNEPLQKGDLVLFHGEHVKHVVIYMDENHIIDSTPGTPDGVFIRDIRLPSNQWCRPDQSNPRYIGTRRVIE